jgi:hypothetical protein
MNDTTHENQGGIEVFVVLLDIIGVVFCRLFLVNCVEIETSVIVLNGLEKRPKSILETALVQWCVVGIV